MGKNSLLHRLRGRNNEGVLLLVIAALLVIMAIAAPGMLTASFAGDILRSAIVNLALAMGLLMIIISGGFDVSFMAIAIFAGYATIKGMNNLGLDGTIWPFLAAALIGGVLAIPNIILVGMFKVPTLIATLGTQTIIRGTLLAFVGSSYIANLPAGLDSLGQATLFNLGSSPVNLLVLPVILICIVVSVVLNQTYYGRSVYAIGGDAEAASRAGVPVLRVQTFLYLVSGIIAGIAGLIYVTINRTANPFDLVGGELNVIAAVVIGGALDTGGRGSVRGTVLGVFLIALVQNSLIRLGVPSFWHTFAVGTVVLLGVAVQALSSRRERYSSPILQGAV